MISEPSDRLQSVEDNRFLTVTTVYTPAILGRYLKPSQDCLSIQVSTSSKLFQPEGQLQSKLADYLNFRHNDSS